MSLETLITVVPPPDQPVEAGRGRNWLEVERSLGTEFPSDYKGFINLHGSGELGSLLSVYNSFSNIPILNLLVRGPEVLEIWRTKRERYRGMRIHTLCTPRQTVYSLGDTSIPERSYSGKRRAAQRNGPSSLLRLAVPNSKNSTIQ
ncbi:MAG: hypothetical protein ACJ78Q_11305 [Chloroflexia bacterium]